MLQDKQIVDDLIKDERFLNVELAFYSVEASPQVKQTLTNILREDQDAHTRLFQFASSRGWYPTLWGDVAFGQQQPFAAPPAMQPWGAQPTGAQAAVTQQQWYPPNVAGIAAQPFQAQPFQAQPYQIQPYQPQPNFGQPQQAGAGQYPSWRQIQSPAMAGQPAAPAAGRQY